MAYTSFRLRFQSRHSHLTSIMAAHVAPGTVVHSDQWSAYNSLYLALQDIRLCIIHCLLSIQLQVLTLKTLSPTGIESSVSLRKCGGATLIT